MLCFGGFFVCLFCFINQLKCFSVTLDSQHRTGCRVVNCHSLSRNGLRVSETGKHFHRRSSRFLARNALMCMVQVFSVGWLFKNLYTSNVFHSEADFKPKYLREVFGKPCFS